MKSELARRIAFTLGALLIYRLGNGIPLPGINVGLNIRYSIFAVWILPYLSAAFLIQMLSMASSKLRALPRSGESGRRKIRRYTIGLGLFLTAFQAYGLALSLQGIPHLVNEPGGLFLLSTTVTLMGGMIFLVWLSELITVHGIGNGLALMLFASWAPKMLQDIATAFELTPQGALSVERVSWFAILCVAAVGLVVFVELARRRVPVEFAGRKRGDRFVMAQPTHLSLKINSAGLMPTLIVPWLYFLPLTVAGLFLGTSPWLVAMYRLVSQVHMAGVIISTIAIFILAFVYAKFVIDPKHVADFLNKHGGVIPGVEPGEATAAHLDRIVSYTTCMGAVYLAAIFLIPALLRVYGQTSFYLGGASVLIVVCTVLDIKTQMRGMSHT
jgi:preprotein translocase subunit SecY